VINKLSNLHKIYKKQKSFLLKLKYKKKYYLIWEQDLNQIKLSMIKENLIWKN